MSIPPIVLSSTGGEGGGGGRGGGPSQRDPAVEIAGMTVPDLLNVLGLHAPVQAGAIKGRVQRRLDALPRNRTYDRGVLKAIERKLLEYMRDNNLVTILLNEESEDYTAIQDTGGQVSQDPTRFYGNRSYPQTIVAGDVNPIDRRVIKKTLVVDSSYRKQYVAGDGIRACAPRRRWSAALTSHLRTAYPLATRRPLPFSATWAPWTQDHRQTSRIGEATTSRGT